MDLVEKISYDDLENHTACQPSLEVRFQINFIGLANRWHHSHFSNVDSSNIEETKATHIATQQDRSLWGSICVSIYDATAVWRSSSSIPTAFSCPRLFQSESRILF